MIGLRRRQRVDREHLVPGRAQRRHPRAAVGLNTDERPSRDFFTRQVLPIPPARVWPPVCGAGIFHPNPPAGDLSQAAAQTHPRARRHDDLRPDRPRSTTAPAATPRYPRRTRNTARPATRNLMIKCSRPEGRALHRPGYSVCLALWSTTPATTSSAGGPGRYRVPKLAWLYSRSWATHPLQHPRKQRGVCEVAHSAARSRACAWLVCPGKLFAQGGARPPTGSVWSPA